jgi:hypothetical protein
VVFEVPQRVAHRLPARTLDRELRQIDDGLLPSFTKVNPKSA